MKNEKRDFDKAAATWDEKPRRIKLAEDIAATISDEVRLTADMAALDFGCGTGLVTLQLQPLVRSITGVDSSKGMLDALQAKIHTQQLTNVKTQYIDIDKGDALSGSYDLVVSSMTFHHVKEIRPLLNQLYRVTAPSGYLCVSDLDLDEGQFHTDNEGVFHFGFDRQALREKFTTAGFVDVRDVTAASITKTSADGDQKTFTVFLIIGRKGPH